jgi:hypothetical protein
MRSFEASMPRDYHSPSSIELGLRCDAAWARTYIDGVREPPVEWNDPDADPRQRAAGLGTATHAILEDHYQFAPAEVMGARWDEKPGQLALALLTHAPPRGPGIVAEGGVMFEWAGITWKGLIDLVDETAPGTGAPIVYDWKTTSNIASWAKDRTTLEADVAASVYAVRTAQRLDLRERVPCRWVYAQTKGPTTTRPVDFVMQLDQAKRTLDRAADEARRLDAIESFDTAKKNPLACRAFGAICMHHVSRGGPCSPGASERVSLGARLVQIRKGRNMSEVGSTQVKESAASRFARRAQAPVETTGTVGEVPAEGASVTESPAAAKPERAPRTPVETKPKAVSTTARGATVVKLASEFAQADAAADKAQAAFEAADRAREEAREASDKADTARDQAKAALEAALSGSVS